MARRSNAGKTTTVAALLLAALLVAAGCGGDKQADEASEVGVTETTAPVTSAPGGDATATTPVPDTVVGGGAAATTVVTRSGGGGRRGSTATTAKAASRRSGTTTAPSARVASGAASGATTGPVGPGVSETTIKVGLMYDKNAGALNQAYGFGGIGQVDGKKAYDLLIEHINKNGGVAGRKLEAVYYVFDQLANKTAEQTAQESCAHWTQDNKVFAAWTGGSIPTLNACLTKAGVVQVGPGFGQGYAETFEKNPYLVDTGTPAAETVGRLLVKEMLAQGFYAKSRPEAGPLPVKIGVMAHDRPAFKASVVALKAALAAKDMKLADEVYITKADTGNDIPKEAADIQAAVLRFKEKGITHVHFFQTSNAFAGLTFWTNAEKLSYYPRYGLTSNDGAQAIGGTLEAAAGSGSAKRAFKMAVGAGWLPLFDVPRADYTGDKESAALKLCKKITEPASNGGFNDAARNKETIASALCDAAFYFKAAVDAGGASPSAASWLAGAAKLDNLGSATTFKFRTTKQRDAVGATRVYSYFDDCSCFHYITEPSPI